MLLLLVAADDRIDLERKESMNKSRRQVEAMRDSLETHSQRLCVSKLPSTLYFTLPKIVPEEREQVHGKCTIACTRDVRTSSLVRNVSMEYS